VSSTGRASGAKAVGGVAAKKTAKKAAKKTAKKAGSKTGSKTGKTTAAKPAAKVAPKTTTKKSPARRPKAKSSSRVAGGKSPSRPSRQGTRTDSTESRTGNTTGNTTMTTTPTPSAGAATGSPRKLPAVPPETLVQWLRDMMLIREFEIRCMQSYQEKKIGGFCHVYIGQEAVAVGCTRAVRPEDPIITAYRDHGHALARGMTARACMAEMYGKVGGCAKGKGGSMHMFDRPNNLYGGHGIVGAQTPMGTGLAFATKYEDEVIHGGKNRRVTLCFLGDGAVNQGAFYETMNLAGLFDIPVIFIVENNGYSMGTAIGRGTTMAEELTIKGRAHGLREATIDGMDVLAVQQDMHELAEWCRENSRPAFVDMKCYRYKGHSMSDPRKYRTREEEETHESNDPIGKFELSLLHHGVVTEESLKELMRGVREEVRDSIEFSNQSPEPPLSDLYTDVFVEPWGRYPGSSQPEFTGGATNVCSFRATDGKGGLV
jgi:pyruvate dehydrogenase E1 component alpha subunit